MKILCDVCAAEPATLFCCADEAALCVLCDRRVHRANKLAVKHCRLSLLPPSSSSPSPVCDVCQEKRAFIFCQEDRAILCRDCDSPIHSASALTARHRRYLLPGLLLSSSLSPDPASDNPTKQAATSTLINSSSCCSAAESSSISDYLIKTLPGWPVEDLLVDDAAAAAAVADGFFQMDKIIPFLEADIAGSTAPEIPIWAAPHVPQAPPTSLPAASHHICFGGKDVSHGNFGIKASVERRGEDAFMVPQMSQVGRNGGNKRSRTVATAMAPAARSSCSSIRYY